MSTQKRYSSKQANKNEMDNSYDNNKPNNIAKSNSNRIINGKVLNQKVKNGKFYCNIKCGNCNFVNIVPILEEPNGRYQYVCTQCKKRVYVDIVGINVRNEKAKYSDDEIARAKYTESKAKFLVRDRIHNDNIDTRNKWIDISNLKSKDNWDINGNYMPEILSFDAEIFDRTEQPKYDNKMFDEEKHQLTYEVAERDIKKQKKAESKKQKSVDRPRYHVEVMTNYTKDRKTEYQIKSIRPK